MPRWDDPRGPRHDWERERGRREHMRDRGRERRFGEEGRRPEPGRFADRGEMRDEGWMREHRGSPYERERERARRYDDAGEAAYARRRDPRDFERYGAEDAPTHGGEPWAYAGQEYGLEGHPGVAGPDPGWGLQRGSERWRNFDFDDPGVGQSQAGYGPAAQTHPDHEFDADYLRWRDEQLRAHDRDYQDWRREQHQQYDEQYRQFRRERQRHFGQAFHVWRAQRSLVGGIPDTSVAPGVSGYGDKTALPGGYNAAYTARPSGMPETPGHLSADPALSQQGGHPEPEGGQHAQGDTSPEFGKEPRQVQASADGRVQGHDEARREEERKGGERPH